MRLICVSIATLALTMALPSQFAPRYNRRADDLEAAIYDELIDAFALDPVISAALDGNVDITGGDVAGVTDNIANINAMAPAAVLPQAAIANALPALTAIMHRHQLLHRLLHLLLSLCQYQRLHLWLIQYLHQCIYPHRLL
ncbi:hypothetical protein LPJ66_006055 [Kickxella alabastrina]|uniref:Uncharacterized protein n=1 Tax=Kickxella alabastrina TaxID=61397 RepID=A0ACC1IF42_9FUNG|nr:hypothetical protein LPJ66_006055 [Kickxella alabastrina]